MKPISSVASKFSLPMNDFSNQKTSLASDANKDFSDFVIKKATDKQITADARLLTKFEAMQ